jgi:hypothetical protein
MNHSTASKWSKQETTEKDRRARTARRLSGTIQTQRTDNDGGNDGKRNLRVHMGSESFFRSEMNYFFADVHSVCTHTHEGWRAPIPCAFLARLFFGADIIFIDAFDVGSSDDVIDSTYLTRNPLKKRFIATQHERVIVDVDVPSGPTERNARGGGAVRKKKKKISLLAGKALENSGSRVEHVLRM